MQAAVALVNTASPPDTLTTLAQLEAFYAEHRYTGRRADRPRGGAGAAGSRCGSC